MKCESNDIKELLPLYLEQALDRSEQERVTTHLETCEDCREELSLIQTMAGEAAPDPGEAFWAEMPSAIYQAVQERQAKRRWLDLSAIGRELFVPRWAWATAAVMILFVLSWLIVGPGQKTAGRAALIADESAYEDDILSAGSMDVASLSTAEARNVDAWAEREYAAVTKAAGDAVINNIEIDIYEELAELDGKSMDRLSATLDRLKREG